MFQIQFQFGLPWELQREVTDCPRSSPQSSKAVAVSELRPLGQIDEIELAATGSWPRWVRRSPRAGVCPVSTGLQGTPSPLMTGWARAVAEESDIHWEGGHRGGFESQFLQLFATTQNPSQAFTFRWPLLPRCECLEHLPLPGGPPRSVHPCRTPPIAPAGPNHLSASQARADISSWPVLPASARNHCETQSAAAWVL